MSNIENLLKRKTVKKFLDKEAPKEILDKAVQVAYRTPTSLNSRPVILVDISDKKEAEWLAGQQAPQSAPHLFLLAFSPEAGVANARAFLAGRYGSSLEAEEVNAKIKKIVGNSLEWARQQVYLTAGYFSATLEAQGISGCWIAGFDKELAQKNLGLPEGYLPELIFACGYADENNPGGYETEYIRKFEDFYYPLG